MTDLTDSRVDAYIAGLPDWQHDICRGVGDLVDVNSIPTAIQELLLRDV